MAAIMFDFCLVALAVIAAFMAAYFYRLVGEWQKIAELNQKAIKDLQDTVETYKKLDQTQEERTEILKKIVEEQETVINRLLYPEPEKKELEDPC